jgi:hypothetical protein
MTNKPVTPPTTEPPRQYHVLAALLSYLVPGLGQVYQGRIGKGLLFFFCLYGMFFFGVYLGQGKNVYLVDESSLPTVTVANRELSGPLAALSHRPQFAGQFWIGIAAWPAIWQYMHFKSGDFHKEHGDPILGNFQRAPDESLLNNLQREGDKNWDLAWVYTVIAGVLNVLVIYDAFAGPAFLFTEEREPAEMNLA